MPTYRSTQGWVGFAFQKALPVLLATGALVACSKSESARSATDSAATSAAAPKTCPGNNDGLTLPAGFCATVFADSLGHARHLAVAPNGDVYVNTWSSGYYPANTTPNAPLLVALRDTNRDGHADVVIRFGPVLSKTATGGTGIAIHNGALFAEAGTTIVRYALSADSLRPAGNSETIVSGLPVTGSHPMHPFAIDSAGTMYINSGSSTNSCQIKDRTLESTGMKPCRELATRGGIWMYDANKIGQTFSPAGRYATGIRNAVGIAIGHGALEHATRARPASRELAEVVHAGAGPGITRGRAPETTEGR